MEEKENLRHYFVASEHLEDEFFQFSHEYLGESFSFTSCNDVFSKNQIDYGSQVLIEVVVEDRGFYQGKILDMCCGYGAIGVILSRFLDAQFDMSDINSFALQLAKINVKNNQSKVVNIIESDMWSSVTDAYDHIVSNPPIKVGKKYLLSFIDGINDHLNSNGSVTIVIKKNLGADSTKKYLTEIFGNCEVLKRDKGYYILRSIKR